jgi:hypothetical protein
MIESKADILSDILSSFVTDWRPHHRDAFWSAIDDVLEFGKTNYHRSLMYPMLLNINGPQNVYSYCVECLEIIDNLVEVRLNYNNEGGGANRVLCKRSIK